MQNERIRQAVRELLVAIGENPDRPELSQTPQKVAEAYAVFFRGLSQNPADALRETMSTEGSELVMLKDIELVSICEHHLLPFTGVAHIAYLPSSKIVGLGRLANLVEILSARPQLQERLTNEIADEIEISLSPDGVLVVIEARHQCVASRGARQPAINTVTLASRGSFRNANQRQEALNLLSVSK
jgi:GTP cyclohydrolase I